MKKPLVLVLVLLTFLSFNQNEAIQVSKNTKKVPGHKLENKMDKFLGNNGKNFESKPVISDEENVTSEVKKLNLIDQNGPVIFEDDFSGEELGNMPRFWKSSDSGSVATISSIDGNWLKFSPRTVYKIDSLLDLPDNFSISFDLVTRSDQARDIGSMGFGFARDNSTQRYISGSANNNAITFTQLHFWNSKITSRSSDTGVSHPMDFPLKSYANKLVNVVITVEGENMKVLVDEEKVLDTEMFNKNAIKYFYISAPFSYKNDANVFFGNFTIKGI